MGISYGHYEPTVRKVREFIDITNLNNNLDAKCIAHFRPQNNWKGEFGFDWFRIGDTKLGGDVNYETLIGQYYDKALTDATTQRNDNGNIWTRFFKADPQPTSFSTHDKIEELKSLYGVFEYSLKNDGAGNPVKNKYYKPVITLYPVEPDSAKNGKFIETGKAELKLYLEFEEKDGKKIKPDKLIFEMDNILMDDKHPLVSINTHTIDKKNIDDKDVAIEITCKAEFATDKEIKVYAISLDASGNQTAKLQAGVLKMIAPAKKTIKDIVIVSVKTPAGTGFPQKLNVFKRNLKQALIKTTITTEAIKNGSSGQVTIDLKNPVNNLYNIDFNTSYVVDTSNGRKNITRTVGLDNLLIRTLERDYPDQFDNHFKLFFLDNTCSGVFDPNDTSNTTPISSTAGYSHFDATFHYGVMFGNHSEFTIAHECLHGLGLPHSFFGDSFLYKAQQTDNIMDYSHHDFDAVNGVRNETKDRVATWYWQWKIINNL